MKTLIQEYLTWIASISYMSWKDEDISKYIAKVIFLVTIALIVLSAMVAIKIHRNIIEWSLIVLLGAPPLLAGRVFKYLKIGQFRVIKNFRLVYLIPLIIFLLSWVLFIVCIDYFSS